MDKVELNLDEKRHGAFTISDGAEQLGEMVVSISGSHLTVYHTEVAAKAEGKGLARQLFNAMIAYVREHGLKIIPLCPYVHAQLKRHPQEFSDVWSGTGKGADS